MTNGASLFEQLSHALSPARGLLSAGRLAEGRASLIAQLEAAGLAPPGAKPLDDSALAGLAPSWVVVMGASMDDGYSVYVVDEGSLDAGDRAALEHADKRPFSWADPLEDPALLAAFARAHAKAGLLGFDEIADLVAELPPDLAFDEATFESWFEGWPHRVSITSPPSAGYLDARITRVCHLFQWL